MALQRNMFQSRSVLQASRPAAPCAAPVVAAACSRVPANCYRTSLTSVSAVSSAAASSVLACSRTRIVVAWPSRWVGCWAQADDDEEASISGLGEEEEDDGSGDYWGLPLPARTYQRSMDIKSIKALRTQSNTAAKEKTLVYLQVGQNGVTQNTLASAMDVLQKHEMVRVRLGEGSGLGRKGTAKALERLLDAVCIHQIGHTITLYRQKNLPRPSNCSTEGTVPEPEPEASSHSQGEEVAEVEQDGEHTQGQRAGRAGGPRPRAAAGARAAKAKASKGEAPTGGRKARGGQPPEFKVL